MLKIIGIQRKRGEFKGVPYDNYMLHCTETAPYSSDSSQMIAGFTVERVKVKAHNLSSVFDGLVGCESDLAALVGSSIRIAYDRFQNPEIITVVDSKEKEV